MCYRNGNHYLLNVSSLPNTLNNRINIQITMADEQQFRLRQIVWAKVSDYPWWPARIVKTLAQRSRKIYRVHFFGDPTYCYLQSQQLLDFDMGLTSLEEGNSMDLILKKSIELAKAAYKKNKNEISTSSQLYEYSAELQPNLGDYFEETKLQSKLVIENIEKIEPEEKNETDVGLQKTEQATKYDNITLENVIQHLVDPNFQAIKSSKGYNNRKQALELQMHLKELLLTKYQLKHIPKVPLDKQLLDKKEKNKKRNQGFKHRLIKKHNNKKQDMIGQSARKLYRIMSRNKSVFPSCSHESVFKVIQAINESSEHNMKKYGKMFMKVTRWIRNIVQGGEMTGHQNCDFQRTLIQRIHNSQFQNFNHQLDQDLKKEDEEKSKVTQIDSCSV